MKKIKFLNELKFKNTNLLEVKMNKKKYKKTKNGKTLIYKNEN